MEEIDRAIDDALKASVESAAPVDVRRCVTDILRDCQLSPDERADIEERIVNRAAAAGLPVEFSDRSGS